MKTSFTLLKNDLVSHPVHNRGVRYIHTANHFYFMLFKIFTRFFNCLLSFSIFILFLFFFFFFLESFFIPAFSTLLFLPWTKHLVDLQEYLLSNRQTSKVSLVQIRYQIRHPFQNHPARQCRRRIKNVNNSVRAGLTRSRTGLQWASRIISRQLRTK